ncbi:hypothetical protein [Clostridium baratii]|uniref:hypothetical protein n=1 Tax=Clostridium baratii TaxID=1561 RepID=UPI003D7ABCFC
MRNFKNKCLREDKLLFKGLNIANNEGWLDDFSENNFLIRAMNNEIDYFRKYSNLIENSPYYAANYCNTFLINFSSRISSLIALFGKKEVKKFFNTGLSAGKNNYKDEQFFRAFSEAIIIDFLAKYGPSKLKEGIYEPKLGPNGSNPEARLIFECGTIVDVEVKTPGFTLKEEEEMLIPTFLLNSEDDKVFKDVSDKYNVKYIKPRALKLKDFINSAGKKFVMPENSKHVNLLYINWTYSDMKHAGFKEPYGLLYNNLNGILKNRKAALELGIEEEALKKITAIIVYQDTFESIIFNDFRDIWNGYKFRLLPNKIMDQRLVDNDILFEITKMRPPIKGDELFPYLGCWKRNLEEAFEVSNVINTHIKKKISKLKNKNFNDNFVYFTKEFYLESIREQYNFYNEWKDYLIPQNKVEDYLKRADGFLIL